MLNVHCGSTKRRRNIEASYYRREVDMLFSIIALAISVMVAVTIVSKLRTKHGATSRRLMAAGG